MTQKPNPISVRPHFEGQKGKLLARAAFAVAQARATHGQPADFVKSYDEVLPLILSRAAASPGTTTASGWASELAQNALANFLVDLAPYSGAARLIAQAIAARALNPEYAVSYPVRTGGPMVPPWVGEGQPIPVVEGAFGLVDVGPPKKMAHILPYSRELAKRSDAAAIVEQMLREDVIAGLDAAFFSTSAGSASTHAGLLYGVSALAGFSGGDREAIESDLLALGTAVAAGGSGAVTFVMAPERIVKIRIRAPELAARLDLAPSAAVPADRIVAADGAALLVSIDEAPEIDTANAAVLHMSSTPLEIVSSTGPTTADPVRSLWQTASFATRVIHELAFAKRRATAVAYLDGATW